MKKSYLILIALFVLSFFTACSNFLTGSSLKEEIEQTIAYNTATKVNFEMRVDNAQMGVIYPAQKTVIADEQFTVEFTATNQILFKNWSCIEKDTGVDATSRVQFVDEKVKVEADSTIRTVTVKVNNTDISNLIIKPVCKLIITENDYSIPVFTSFHVYSDKNKTKELTATNYDKSWETNKTLALNNTAHNFHITVSGTDEGSGISKLKVVETLIKDEKGKDGTYIPIESYFDYSNYDFNENKILEFDTEVKNNLKGVAKLTFSLIDYAGNESRKKTIYIIKTVDCQDIKIFHNNIASENLEILKNQINYPYRDSKNGILYEKFNQNGNQLPPMYIYYDKYFMDYMYPVNVRCTYRDEDEAFEHELFTLENYQSTEPIDLSAFSFIRKAETKTFVTFEVYYGADEPHKRVFTINPPNKFGATAIGYEDYTYNWDFRENSYYLIPQCSKYCTNYSDMEKTIWLSKSKGETEFTLADYKEDSYNFYAKKIDSSSSKEIDFVMAPPVPTFILRDDGDDEFWGCVSDIQKVNREKLKELPSIESFNFSYTIDKSAIDTFGKLVKVSYTKPNPNYDYKVFWRLFGDGLTGDTMYRCFYPESDEFYVDSSTQTVMLGIMVTEKKEYGKIGLVQCTAIFNESIKGKAPIIHDTTFRYIDPELNNIKYIFGDDNRFPTEDCDYYVNYYVEKTKDYRTANPITPEILEHLDRKKYYSGEEFIKDNNNYVSSLLYLENDYYKGMKDQVFQLDYDFTTDNYYTVFIKVTDSDGNSAVNSINHSAILKHIKPTLKRKANKSIIYKGDEGQRLVYFFDYSENDSIKGINVFHIDSSNDKKFWHFKYRVGANYENLYFEEFEGTSSNGYTKVRDTSKMYNKLTCSHKDGSYLETLYVYPDYYISEKQLTDATVINSLKGYQIKTNLPVCVQTVYSSVNYGDDPDVWGTRGIEVDLDVLNPDESPSNMYYSPVVDKVPRGNYYTALIHFADCSTIMYPVEYKK